MERAARTRVRQHLCYQAIIRGEPVPERPTHAELLWAAQCDLARYAALVNWPGLAPNARAFAREMLEVTRQELAKLAPPKQLPAPKPPPRK